MLLLLNNDVVMADNINLFKKCLDKFWSSYDFVYLFRAQPLGTGSSDILVTKTKTKTKTIQFR